MAGGNAFAVVVDRDPKSKSRLTIADVSAEDLRLVSEVSFECIECIETLIAKAKSIHAPLDLRDISLTLATLDRQLYNYVADHLLRSRKFLPRPGSQSFGNVAARRAGKRTLQAALMRAHEMLDDGHVPLICGGVASLLYNLKGSLLETKETVNELSHFLYTTPRDAAYVAGYFLLSGAVAWKMSSWLSLTLQVLSLKRRARWDGPMKTPVGVQFNINGGSASRRLTLLVHCFRRCMGWLRTTSWKIKAFLSLSLAAYVIHRGMRARAIAKLRACNRQLLLLQRIMGCVMFALDEARMRRAKSYVELVAYPSKGVDYDMKRQTSEMPAARLLVESVAYPCDPYLHLYTHGRHFFLKMALDLIYSSTGVAWNLSGGNGWAALAMTQFVIPYFLLNPARASSYAAGVRQHMSPQFFQFLISLGCNPATKRANFISHFRDFNVAHRFRIPTLPKSTYIFQKSGHLPASVKTATSILSMKNIFFMASSSQDPVINISEDSKMPKGGPVFIHIHGGGFCTNMLSADLPFISKVARANPQVPILVTEYSTAPENPFPKALDEICTMYEWVRAGGLGFKPSRVVLCGESAGANFVCALCVRYVGHHFPKLKQDCGATSPALSGIERPPIKAPLPDSIILGYPSLNLGASPSPSRALHMCDPILPIAAGNLAKAYHSDIEDLLLNPQVSPIFTSDAVLSHFPPTSIMPGGMDILLDDAVDFHVRLRRNGVPGHFRIFRTLPHGFWSMGDILPEARDAQKLGVRWITQALDGRKKKI
eukprot:CAMPEP_0167765820 /NCGR_PEP_ID=MMETSP0110_2-20121227/14936_1 /TAXON_ID=629695 /ORGANISM="Gymnochlora sp., Strain CCMP2014" /LENGTH=767 /DNA_ID=CAMNT_0007653649 /DNA_START=83 /DNA_END=2387 /DNA_ORIENTATION=+